MDKSGIVIDCNKATEELIGYSKEEIIGKPFLELKTLDSKDLPELTKIFKKLKEHETKTHELEIIGRGGERRWVRVVNSVLKRDKTVLGYQIITTDVTEIKRIEEEREKTLAQLRERVKEQNCLYEVANAIQANDDLDKLFSEITSIIPKGWQYPGITRAKILFDEKEYVSEPFEETEWRQSTNIAIDGKHRGSLNVFYLEERPKLDEGPFLKEERNLVDSIARSFSETIERKNAERELVEERNLLRTLIDNLPDYIYAKDTKSRFVLSNIATAREVGAKNPDELIGKTDFDFFPHNLAERYHSDEKSVLESGQSLINREELVIDHAGNRLWVLTTKVPLRDSSGQIVGLVGMNRDITERKKAEEEVKAHREHLELINKILRHDLINDLTVIRSSFRLYKNTEDQEYLQKIPSYVDKSVELINKMRGLESFMSFHKDLGFYNAIDIIKNVIKDYPSIDFKIEGSCKVVADEALSSVIDNIISNAVAHAKTDRIDINILKTREVCEIRIADYGVGIPEEIKGKIFEEGFQYGETGRSGLGLFIVKKTLERYGGSISIEDNKPSGTIFILKLKGIR